MTLPDNIADCHRLILSQAEQMAHLLDRVKELESLIKQNSSNSSKPPSTDLVKSKRRPGIRRKPKKKGGQKGHKGNTLKMVAADELADTKPLKPSRCRCGQRLARQVMEVQARRQVFDIPDPKLEVIEYQQLACICPNCGEYNAGQFPDRVKAPVQYGSGVRALINLLSIKCQLSEKNISELFEDFFGYAVNSGTIQSALNQAHHACEAVAEQIKTQALASACLHVDETGTQIEKERRWLHVMSNTQWTYLYAHASRGKKAILDSVPALFSYSGALVHDCWASYWSVRTTRHVLCNAHLLRELHALIEQGSSWAGQMHDLLMALYRKHCKGEQIHRRTHQWREYKRICQLALKEEPPPKKNARGKLKKSKGRNLAERFIKHQEAVLRFALEPDIPFTNNQAERDVRPAKGKQKVAGCFRSWKGAHRYARLQSVFSTWRKQGYDIFKELKAILNGNQFSFAAQMT
jgi:transposase